MRLAHHKLGMSLLEVMVGLIVIGISSYAAYELWTGAEKSTMHTQQLGEMGEFVSQANQISSKILTDIGPDSNRGICRFIKLTSLDDSLHKISSGVSPMKLVLFRATPSSASSSLMIDKNFLDPYPSDTSTPTYDDWDKVFESTYWTQDTNCSDAITPELANAGRYQRCYKPVYAQWPQVASVEVLTKRNPRLIVNIAPVRFMSAALSSGSTNKLDLVPYPTASSPLTELNAIDHALVITTKLTWEGDSSPQSATAFSVVWPGEFTCLAGFKVPGSATTAYNDAEYLHNNSYANYQAQMDYWREHPKATAAALGAAASSLSIAPGNKKIFADNSLPVMLNVSGVGSGAIDNTKPYILIYSTTNPTSGMDVTFNKGFYTKAYIQSKNGENRAITNLDNQYTFGAACQEVQYRCKNSNALRSWSEQMDFSAFLKYTRNLRVTTSPTLSFVNSATSEVLNMTTATNANIASLDATSATTPNVRFFHPSFNYGSGQLTLDMGTGELRMLAKKMNQPSACPTMCAASQEANPKWQTKLDFPGVKTDTGADATFTDTANKVGCICCTMKQCYAWGNKLAPCSEQRAESLDAVIPECEASDPSTTDPSYKKWAVVNATNYPAASNSVAPAALSGADTCISAKVNGGKLELGRESCATSLPVLCYAVGRFFVAKTPLTATNASVNLSAGVDAAANACFNIGTQKVRKGVLDGSAGLDGLLTSQGNYDATKLPTTVVGNHYQYVDGATQGLFLAPQSFDQVNQAIEAINKEASPANTGKFWVNLKVVNGVVETPVLPVASANSVAYLYTSYYDNTFNLPKLQYVRDVVHGFTAPAAGAVGGAILLHSRRYSGVVPASAAVAQFRPLPVLCWNSTDDKYFLTTATTNIQIEAATKCWNEGGFFVAPSKPLEWIQAMLAVAPNHSHLPWPQPAGIALTSAADAPASSIPAAWVGLSYSSANGYSQFYLHKNYTGFSDNEKTMYYVLTGKAATSVNATSTVGDLLCENAGTINIESGVVDCSAGSSSRVLSDAQWNTQSLNNLKSTLLRLKTAYPTLPSASNALFVDKSKLATGGGGNNNNGGGGT